MRKYLENLQKKPDHHKRRFALLASTTITLFIFGIWSMTTFGINPEISVVGKTFLARPESIPKMAEVGPLESLGKNIASAYVALKENIKELSDNISEVYYYGK